MKRTLRVIDGTATAVPPRRSAIAAAYDHFRLDRQGNLMSPKTLERYEWAFTVFSEWLESAHPEVHSFETLDVGVVREWRMALAARPTRSGRLYQPATIHSAQVMLKTFLGWAEDEGYPVDPRILRLKGVRVPLKEPTLFHIAQLRRILAACQHPREDIAVRILVGSGLRASELIGLSLTGPDGLPDLMLDSMDRGRVELRVRWDAGSKGRNSRRVPVTPKLAAAIKRYEARYRGEALADTVLVNEHGRQYTRSGLQQVMERLRHRVGFDVHAHAFRHTFATVACQLGWNLERLRAAMGHADYAVLHRYIRLSTERGLGQEREWEDFILANAAIGPGIGRQR